LTTKERTAWQKEKDRLYQRERRRSKGVKPRHEYEANSLSATKPWQQLGISRSSWYRRPPSQRHAAQP
jgi:hypothetical protein